MNYKKLLATAVFTLGVWMSVGVGAQTWNPQNNPVITADVNGTNYDFSYLTGSFTDNSTYFNTTYMPWWGGTKNNADAFATAVGGQLNYLNVLGPFGPEGPWSVGPFFAYKNPLNDQLYSEFYFKDYSSVGGYNTNQFSDIRSYAVATPTSGGAVVPEMNASLIPQVGLLLACLFFLFGRKREVVEPMLAA